LKYNYFLTSHFSSIVVFPTKFSFYVFSNISIGIFVTFSKISSINSYLSLCRWKFSLSYGVHYPQCVSFEDQFQWLVSFSYLVIFMNFHKNPSSNILPWGIKPLLWISFHHIQSPCPFYQQMLWSLLFLQSILLHVIFWFELSYPHLDLNG